MENNVNELTKNTNTLSLTQMATSGGIGTGDINTMQQIQMEALKNDYNDITNSNAKYIHDMESFFLELIEIIKNTLGDKNFDNKEKALKLYKGAK